MNTKYIIILGKHAPVGDEEDWPHDGNRSTVYQLNSKKHLITVMNRILKSEQAIAPWWWIFDGDIDEGNLMLSGAIDPDDIDIIKENLS